MDVYQAIKTRRSIRKYSPEPIPAAKLENVLEAGRLAPSAKNLQPWRFIVTRKEDLKQKLVRACKGQQFIAGADCIITVAVNQEQCYQSQGSYMTSFAVDGTIALQQMMLAATAEGLGTCWIGAFSEPAVKDVLGIPDPYRVVGLTPLGYPVQEGQDRGRKPLEDIVIRESWT